MENDLGAVQGDKLATSALDRGSLSARNAPLSFALWPLPLLVAAAVRVGILVPLNMDISCPLSEYDGTAVSFHVIPVVCGVVQRAFVGGKTVIVNDD